LDINKIRTQLGWQPEETLGSGLLKTIQWYLDHPEWVSAIRQQQDFQEWLERNYDKRQ
jgi:dTDP-glucose 4,6-dehydratase